MISHATHRLTIILLLGWMGVTINLNGQTFKGRVIDSQTEEGVAHCRISSLGNKQTAESDSLGNFIFSPSGDSILVFAEGYKTGRFKFKKGMTEFRIDPFKFELPPAIIYSGPMEIVKNHELFVYDYELWNENVFAITRNPKSKERMLQILTMGGDEDGEIADFPEDPVSLFIDCEERLYVLGQTLVFKLSFTGSKYDYDALTLEDFRNYVEPCKGKLNKSRFVTIRPNDQRLVYFPLENGEEFKGNIYVVTDSFAIRQMRDDSIMASKGLDQYYGANDSRKNFQAGLDARYKKKLFVPRFQLPWFPFQMK